MGLHCGFLNHDDKWVKNYPQFIAIKTEEGVTLRARSRHGFLSSIAGDRIRREFFFFDGIFIGKQSAEKEVEISPIILQGWYVD